MILSAAAEFIMSPGGWTGLAACITAAVAIGAAIIGRNQLSEARRLRKEQAQPYVVVFLSQIEGDAQHMDLVIKNFGKTAATDVRVAFPVALESGALARHAFAGQGAWGPQCSSAWPGMAVLLGLHTGQGQSRVAKHLHRDGDVQRLACEGKLWAVLVRH